MKELENDIIQKTYIPSRIEGIKLSDFLPENINKQEFDEIMKRTGMENPTSEENVKVLMLAYYESQEHKNYRKELINLDPKDKKEVGRKFIEDIKNHPVIGKVEKGKYKSEKLRVIDNVAWYGKIFQNLISDIKTSSFPKEDGFINPDALKKVQNSKIGESMYLSDRFMKLSTKWRSRSGRNKSTENNPYGIDMGDAFIHGYAKDEDNFELMFEDEYELKDEEGPQSDKKDIIRFQQDMNYMDILQAYYLTMERILSDKTDIKQKAYLKVMTEKHMLGELFNKHNSYAALEGRYKGNEKYLTYLLKGKEIKINLDMSSEDYNKLPDKYEYFNELTEEECQTIISTPYKDIPKDLKEKIESKMPSEETFKEKFKKAHFNDVKKRFDQIQKENQNNEIFNLDILKPEKQNDPNALDNLSQEEKAKIEKVFDIVFGPLIEEEALYEDSKNSHLKFISSNKKEDIVSHFWIKNDKWKNIYMAEDDDEAIKRLENGYYPDEIIKMKARALQKLTDNKKIAYRTYMFNSDGNLELDIKKSIVWDNPVKQEFKKPEDIKSEIEKKYDHNIIKEAFIDNDENEEDNYEDEYREDIINTNTKKLSGPETAKKFSDYIKKTFLNDNAPHKLDDESKALYNNWNAHCKKLDKIGKGENPKIESFKNFLGLRELKTSGEIHDKSNFMRCYDLLDDQKEKDEFIQHLNELNSALKLNLDIPGLVAGKALLPVNVNPERSPEESKMIYSRVIKDNVKASGMAIYASQAFGDLQYFKNKDLGIQDDINELEKSLKAVSEISDSSKPEDAKNRIERMKQQVDDFISTFSQCDNEVLIMIRDNIMAFRNVAYDYYQEIQSTEKRGFRDILKSEYSNMLKGLSDDDRKSIINDAQKTKNDLVKQLKQLKADYKELENCNKTGKKNSRQFDDMFNAVKDAAENLTENSTIQEIKEKMSKVMSTTGIYKDKINSQGWYAGNSIVGKKGFIRLRTAKNLSELSVKMVVSLHGLMVDRSMNPYMNIDSQINKMKEANMNAEQNIIHNQNDKKTGQIKKK